MTNFSREVEVDSSEVLWERNGWRRCMYRGHRDDHESDSSRKGFLHTARLGPAFPRWNPLGIVALADFPAFIGFYWLLGCFPGAACGNRTRDLLITSETLYQLS